MVTIMLTLVPLLFVRLVKNGWAMVTAVLIRDVVQGLILRSIVVNAAVSPVRDFRVHALGWIIW